MKNIKNVPVLSLLLVAFLFADQLSAVVFIDESFSGYTNGAALSSPWVVSGTTSGSAVTVQTSSSFNGFTPTGQEIYVVRPSGGGVPFSDLTTGAQGGSTSAWTLAANDTVRLTLDFYAGTDVTNTTGFQFLLRSNSVTFFGFKVTGTGSSAAKLQYLTTNSAGSATDLGASISLGTWYRLTADVTVGNSLSAGNASSFNISVDQLGTGGGNIYTSPSALTLTYGSSIAGTGLFETAVSGGNISYGVADVDLATVPEPSTVALVIGGTLTLAILRRQRSLKS